MAAWPPYGGSPHAGWGPALQTPMQIGASGATHAKLGSCLIRSTAVTAETSTPRRAMIEQRIAQARAQLAAIDARHRVDARKQETRRCILLGAVLLSALRRSVPVVIDGTRASDLRDLPALLDHHLTRAHDRAVFGLPPLPTEAP